jgi:flagellar protein FliO/FliZ
MLNMLFGEGQYAIKLLLAFVIIFGVLALALWLLRRFGGERLGNAAARGRQPRLAVIDQANVDGRRRLILVRRDNVEHLLMIGGPSDVVVEPNIVRGAAAAREPAVPRPVSAGDTLPRAVPLGEGNMWPLAPEPAPRAEPLPRAEPGPRLEPVSRPELPPRAQRPAPGPAEEAAPHWPSPEAETPPPPRPLPTGRERSTDNDPLAGLAEELAREPSPTEREPAPQPRRQPLRRDLRSRPAPVPTVGTPSSAGQTRSPADHNLAEMAQRLEAALRRPAKGSEIRPASSAPTPESGAEEADETEAVTTVTEPARAAQPGDAPRSARNDARPSPRSDTNPAPQKSLYDSLEQEMASLLGRPNNKQ